MKANGGAQGGASLVVQDQHQGWSIELTRFRCLDVVSCKVAADGKRTPPIGAYLPPSTLEHLPELEEALTQSGDQEMIVLGDLNGNIVQS